MVHNKIPTQVDIDKILGIRSVIHVIDKPKVIMILNYLLKHGEANVTDLMICQRHYFHANTSRDLKLLSRLGLVTSRRDGKNIIYRLNMPKYNALCKAIIDFKY